MDPIKNVSEKDLERTVKDLEDEGCTVVVKKQHDGLYTIIATPKESSTYGEE